MKKKLVIILAIVVVLIVGLLIVVPMISKNSVLKKNGNIKVKSDSTTYEYGTKIINSYIEIKKSEYSETKLTISITNTFDNGIRRIDCYDSDFNPIDSEFDYSYKLGKLVIEGSDVEKISGLTIYFQDSYAEIRYLNTKQYAILYYTWAEDAGYVSHDDESLYYTQAELDSFQAAHDLKQQEFDEIFAKYEGLWCCEDNEELYINFYTTDRGVKYLEYTYLTNTGSIIKSSMGVNEMYLVETGNEKGSLYIYEYGPVDYELIFDTLEGNCNALVYNDVIYVRCE